MPSERTDVLVAGGGLVGLSMAAFLAWQGVSTILVERHEGISSHPRARGANPRTMELLRQIGLEQRVRASASAQALASNTGVIAVESLAGKEIGELRQSYHADSGADYSHLGPSGWCLCHQDELEPLLQERAAELGADLRFATELTGFSDDGAGVTAEVRDSAGGTRTIAAHYLVAADGSGSHIRQRLGISLDGPGVLARFMNIQFRADLREALGDRRFIICYTTQAGTRCALLPIDNDQRWLLHVLDPGEGSFDTRRCTELVRAAAGLPEAEVRVESVLPWDSAAAVASTFASGRVFLAGDAAHVMPPSGAFGSNTGIADAHNLAWKLAAVLKDVAAPSLLDSYDRERRPAAAATVRQAVLRSKDRPRLVSQEAGPPDPEIQSDPVVIFGFRYPGPDPQDAGGWQPVPDAAVGSRAPHLRLASGGNLLSTIDLFGRDFVLLTGPDGESWREELANNPQRSIVIQRVTNDETGLRDVDGQWAAAFQVAEQGAVLVRPDGVVCWRAPGKADARSVAGLWAAMNSVLGKSIPDLAEARTP